MDSYIKNNLLLQLIILHTKNPPKHTVVTICAIVLLYMQVVLTGSKNHARTLSIHRLFPKRAIYTVKTHNICNSTTNSEFLHMQTANIEATCQYKMQHGAISNTKTNHAPGRGSKTKVLKC